MISIGEVFYFMPGWGLIIIVLAATVLLLSYFSPVFVALLRGHQNTLEIFILTLFFGWTLLGWIIALVWSFGDIRPRVVDRH